MSAEPTKTENGVRDFTVRLELKALRKVLRAAALCSVGWIRCFCWSILHVTRRKACSHESSWSHHGAVVGCRGTVVGNVTSPTMLRRHFHDTSTTGSCWYSGVCAHCLPCSIGGSHNGSYRGSIVEASWTTTILYKMCFNRSSMLYCCWMDGHHYFQ